jgi:pilus assembly protein CpaC
VLMVGALVLLPAPAEAQTYVRVTPASYGGSQKVTVAVNKSMLLDLPADAKEVIVSQPGVAAAIMRTKRRAIIQGTTGGSTNIFFLDEVGNPIAVVDVNVITTDDAMASVLTDTIRRNIPGSNVVVESVGDRVVLSGSVRANEDLAAALAIAGQVAGDIGNVASVIQVAGAQQVMLKVTVAEVQRDATKQFGIDLNIGYSSGGFSTGIINTPAVNTGNSMRVGASFGGLSLEAVIRALESRGALRLLAEPTLVAMSGQPAEFLAGGQIPYATTGDNGQQTVVFRDFGVALNFTPAVKSDGAIELLVDTSVSQPAGDGAITERRASTTVELPPGCTLAIAGMFQDTTRQQMDQWPGLGDIPILGALFRSREFVRNQTELVILVTPYLAQPGGPVALPTDDYHVATDAEAIFLGRMESMYAVGEDANGMRGSYNGSVGFVLD